MQVTSISNLHKIEVFVASLPLIKQLSKYDPGNLFFPTWFRRPCPYPHNDNL